MLPDVSGDEVEAYMIDKSLISPNDNSADAPTDSACTDEQHAAMDRAAGKINFLD
jgi:monothiol glutaredoxin